MLRFNPRTIIEQFKSLADRFASWGLRPRRQAGFTDPRDEGQWDSRRRLLDWLGEKTGWRLATPCQPCDGYLRLRMKRKSGKPTKGNFLSVVEKRPFSYAIIGSDEAGFNYNWFALDSA
jgi:hypothetical protein